MSSTSAFKGDVHSYYTPGQPTIEHIDLTAMVNFRTRRLHGKATIIFTDSGLVDLDTRDLTINKVTDLSGRSLGFEVGKKKPILGSKLSFRVPTAKVVIIHYTTSPKASGLQWLTPKQAGGNKKYPFLYTQGEAIHTRSYLPCQDTPAIKFTFSVALTVPGNLRGLVACNNHLGRTENVDGTATERWHMEFAVPAYLVAFAVGELKESELSDRSKVWAQPHVIAKAAEKFAGLVPNLMEAGERLFGEYPFGRYDLLILPASFPYGGMENPCLTFLTPLILYNDRVACNRLIGHELAHSWTGNLVTNATWGDFWVNEGWTCYAEHRLLEVVEGLPVANLVIHASLLDLRRDFTRWYDLSRPSMTALAPDVDQMDPDEAFSRIPYVKGELFLLTLEAAVGREAFDRFICGYINDFAYKSITTEQFLTYAAENLPPGTLEAVRVWDWIYSSDLPDNAPATESNLVDAVQPYVKKGRVPTKSAGNSWIVAQWGLYLGALHRPASLALVQELNARFGLATSTNSILRWMFLLLAVESGHWQLFRSEIRDLLTMSGSITFVRTLYGGLCKTPSGRAEAQAIFTDVRTSYHPISVFTTLSAMREAGVRIK